MTRVSSVKNLFPVTDSLEIAAVEYGPRLDMNSVENLNSEPDDHSVIHGPDGRQII